VGGTCGTYGRERKDIEKFVQGLYKENQNEIDHLEDHGIDGRMGSELILGRLAGGVYNGSRWLRIGAGGGLL
jgi:hypothetical protein